MRVLMLSHTYLPAHYRGKLRWLAAQHKVDLTLVALPELRLPSGTRLVFQGLPEPFDVQFLRPLAFRDNNVLRVYPPYQMAALLRRVRPDIVHVEAEPHALTLGLTAWLKPRFTYHLVAFTWENLYRHGRGPLRWLEPFSLSRVDWMLAGNTEAVDVVRWRGFSGPVTVIPQVGLNPDHFRVVSPHPALLATRTTGFRVGFLGRLVLEKGVLDLLEAFLPLADRASLVLIGEGPLSEELRGRVQAAQIEDRVVMAGFVPYEQIPSYLNGLDVLVLPSHSTPQWKEQFGHVLAEAMLAGVPVVGSGSGAIPEVVNAAGLTFPEGDVAALRACLVTLMDRPEERQRLARAGYQRALAHFTDEAIAQATFGVYKQVLAR